MTPSVRYIFLMSTERSGSNLLTKILDNHPEICGPAPSHLIRLFIQNIGNYGNIQHDKNWECLLQDVADYMNNMLGEWKSNVDYKFLSENCMERNLRELIELIYQTEASANNKKIIAVKENKIYRFSETLFKFFGDECKFVYLVRDPRDMVLSYLRSTNHPGGIISGTYLWQTDQENYIQLYQLLKEKNKIHLLRYEDLLSAPERQLEKLCSFLGIAYADDMINYHQNQLTRKNAQRIGNWTNLEKPLFSKNFNKYKTALKEHEIQYIEAQCKKEMGYLGYPVFAGSPDNPEKIKKQVKKEEDNMPSAKLNVSQHEEMIRRRRQDIINRVINRKIN